MRCLNIVLLVTVCCWQRSRAQVENLPTATDILWSSINFKTILDWRPLPTNYTYTVLVRSPFTDWIKKCINIQRTSCDVTDLMKDVRSTYEVRISSEIRSAEVEEFPYAEGPTINPYEQTTIGKPKIQNFSLSDDQSRLTVVVSDTLTPYKYENNTYMTLRDVFQNDFVYTLYYRKASSTGKKQQSSSTNEIIINTERGESYCFFVQASVPSRKFNRVSQNSDEVCTPSGGRGGESDLTVLVAVGIAVALIVFIVSLSVALCLCRKKKKEENAKETVPLNGV